jgi:hypothetical protein
MIVDKNNKRCVIAHYVFSQVPYVEKFAVYKVPMATIMLFWISCSIDCDFNGSYSFLFL